MPPQPPERTSERLSTGHGLLEGPVWSPTLGLVVADATVGGVLRFDGGNAPSVLIPHRRGIGGLALHADGGVVVSGRNLAWKRPLASGAFATDVLLERDLDAGVTGFNDLTTDSRGRIYVGSLGFFAAEGLGGPPGRLHLVDTDGTTRVVAEDVLMTNGLAFSPSGDVLYHADSLRSTVYAYSVAPNGDLGRRRTFAEAAEGRPDGLAVDADGGVWIVLSGAGQVVRHAPDGRPSGIVRLTDMMVTSCCFGGADGRDLYVVSGTGEHDSQLSGNLFRTRSEVAGAPVHAARVRHG